MLMTAKGKFHRWMGLVLAILAGAALLVLVLGGPSRETPANRSAASTLPATESVPTSKPTLVQPLPAHTDEISPKELDRFRKNLRRTLLRDRLGRWLSSDAARDLFLAGHGREAIELAKQDLAARAGAGDRDAAVALLQMHDQCQTGLAQQAQATLDSPISRQVPESQLSRLRPATRARLLAALDLQVALSELEVATCRDTTPFDSPDLEAEVRHAAADGHTPSLITLAWRTADTTQRERYLLSASLLGDAEAQLSLATHYGLRLPGASADRGKKRFWLEQASAQIPAAALALGKCLRAECDGRPAEPGRARELIESAAQKGNWRAIELLTRDDELTVGDGQAAQYSWREFRARLAEDGCYPAYPALALNDDEGIRERARNSFRPNDRAAVERQAQELYDHFAASARAGLGCN